MIRSILVIIILLGGAGAACFDRFPALLLYIWFALFRPQEWIWVDITGLHLSLIIGLLLVVPSVFSGILPNLTHPLSLGAIALLGSSLLAQVNALRPDIGWDWIDYLARLLLVSLLAVTLTNTRQRLIQTLAVTAGSFGFHAAKAGFASLAGGGVQFFSGLAGAFVDNNGYAVGTVMIVPLLAAAGQNMRRWWLRQVFYLAALLSAFTVVSLFSRGGFLGLVFMALTFVLLQRRRVLGLLGLVAVALVGLMVAPIPQGWFERIQTIQTYEQIADDSSLSRLHFWHVATDMALSEPFGVGLQNYEIAYNRYDFTVGRYGNNRAVHSSHFQILAETGFMGAMAWSGLFIFALFVAIRARARSKRPEIDPEMQTCLWTVSNGWIASMVGFLVGGAFVAMALNDLTWLTFALVAVLDRLSARAVTGERTEAAAADERLAAVPPRPLGWPGVSRPAARGTLT